LKGENKMTNIEVIKRFVEKNFEEVISDSKAVGIYSNENGVVLLHKDGVVSIYKNDKFFFIKFKETTRSRKIFVKKLHEMAKEKKVEMILRSL
jgi:hypothetical protein